MRALALVLTVGACSYEAPPNSSGSEDGPLPTDGPSDASTDAPPDSFVGPPPSACVQKWLSGTPPQFSNPVFVDNQNFQTDERDPWLSADELIIYYSSSAGGDLDVLFATRSAANLAFGSPTVKTSLNDDNAEDSKVAMTGDELTAFVSSRRGGGEGEADLWVATRATGGTTAFDTPATQLHLANVNDGGRQLDPHVSPDGLRLYFANGDPQKLVVSSRATTDADFQAPVEIPGIAMAMVEDADPTLTADERVLIFSSSRVGLGGSDLWYATRPERDQPFGEVRAVPINSAFNDGDAHVSNDGCRIYFSSERAAGNNDFDLFFTQMQ